MHHILTDQRICGGDPLTNALLLIILRTAKAFPDNRCSANFAFKFSKNPNFDLRIELVLSLFDVEWSNYEMKRFFVFFFSRAKMFHMYYHHFKSQSVFGMKQLVETSDK